ncbi:two-component sensor histidine kinase [Catellatospora sp. IY07-71]|uniref:sensor histidine kinase n=1 Tax=Catellatospora sp. IY07-71 TaxID=2728827 RepID=UPI001BB6F9F2|nr:HAMP domain-containing sensor histidine kinase [Catellatospora sp. IY07-71]BCJ72543.1 two-component sensor histidine kinase [Catellatospora sp. IY07-71]
MKRLVRGPKRWSLQARLLAGVLALVCAGFVVADMASVALLRMYLVERIDEQLHLTMQQLVKLEPADVTDAEAELLSQSRRKGKTYFDAYVLEFLDENGRQQVRYAGGDEQRGGPALPALDIASVRQRAGTPFFVPNAESYHRHPGYQVLVGERESGKGSVVIAYDLTGVAKTMGRLGAIEIAVTLAVLGLATALGVWVIRMSLRPLTEVEQTAEKIIAGGDLSRRVPEQAGTRTEMGRLSRTLNTMLTQIEGSFAERTESEARLRRFVADASHELRTPLAGIRGLAELHRQGVVTDPAEVSALLARIETEATRMGLLVEDLLLLARLDEQRPLRSEPVDLVPLAADAIEAAQLRDLERPLRLELLDGEPPVVRGDEDRLRQVVTNLVGNALTHTPAGTPVTVRVGVEGDRALLEVVDRGPGLAPEHAERVFERFYRADPARARDHERSPAAGSGLGLSIVAALVTAHGGDVCHRATPGGGATFRITLPLA